MTIKKHGNTIFVYKDNIIEQYIVHDKRLSKLIDVDGDEVLQQIDNNSQLYKQLMDI